MANVSHRSGPLKQANKSHKTGNHRSKGAVDGQNRGRVSSISGTILKRSKKVNESRITRRNRLCQIRSTKRDQVLREKRAAASGTTPPFLIAIVPLTATDSCNDVEIVLQNCKEGDGWVLGKNGHLSSPQRLKRRYHVIQPNMADLFAVLDVTKVCDAVLFVVDEQMNTSAEKVLQSIVSQGLPTAPVFAVKTQQLDSNLKHKNEAKKSVKRWVELNCASACDKVYHLNSEMDVQMMMRHFGEQTKAKHNSLRQYRPHVLAENVEYDENDGATGTLKIAGYVRGTKLNVNRLIHLPGWGDFQLDKIEILKDPNPMSTNSAAKVDIDMSDAGILTPSPNLQDDLTSENEPDMMDGEQTWPTEEEITEADHKLEGKKKLVKVPKGTSDYQASWIIDEAAAVGGGEDENSEEEEEEDLVLNPEEADEDSEDEMADENFDAMTIQSEVDVDNNYDEKHVNFEEEKKTYSKIKAARMDEMFPDEVDTPMELSARERFQKFRGLKSFRSSPWDPKENLPYDYARIFQFENFKRTRKTVLATNEDEGDDYMVSTGAYVVLHVKNVPHHLYADWNGSQEKAPLVLFGMLKHENKMSVMNVAVKRRIDSMNDEAIASKERLIFHVGFRRFATCPIFSAHTNSDKHKYERYWRPNEIVVMSMFAPITFPPANVLVYRELSSGRHCHVGSGSLLSMDPDRLAIKRSVLSGHPFKVNKRSSVVRFMFFSREDIDWFKPVELRTKHGRRGHIKEPLGTHGHMKVILDGTVTQQDTVLMNLFKRVYPKWNYDPYVNRYITTHKLQLAGKKTKAVDDLMDL
jgi:pre-rRNA-processing protein TSR1